MNFQLLESGKPLPDRVGDMLLVYDPGTSIVGDLSSVPKYPLVVGYYTLEDEVCKVADFPDITERAEIGPIRIYDWDFLERIEAFKYGKFWEYYARLKLYASLKNHLVLKEVLSRKTFKRSYGKLHTEAFQYLQYTNEDEILIERIFIDFLKNLNGYLRKPLNLPLYEKPYKPYISVIIPVKDRERYIGKTLESLLDNDFEHWECIVVDNGSKDGTRDIVRRFSNEDRRIRLVEVSGKSLTECLNIGLRYSRGWIVSQLDSDDIYTPDALRTIYEYHREHDVGLAISYYDVVDDSGNKIEDIDTVKHLEFSINNILRVEGAGAVRSYKREVLEKVGGFDEYNYPHFGEDYDLVLRIVERYKVGRIHKVLYKYRRHAESTDATFPILEKKRIKTKARWVSIHRRRLINLSILPSLSNKIFT